MPSCHRTNVASKWLLVVIRTGWDYVIRWNSLGARVRSVHAVDVFPYLLTGYCQVLNAWILLTPNRVGWIVSLLFFS